MMDTRMANAAMDTLKQLNQMKRYCDDLIAERNMEREHVKSLQDAQEKLLWQNIELARKLKEYEG